MQPRRVLATAAVIALSISAVFSATVPAAAAPGAPKDIIFFLHYVSDPANASKTYAGGGSTWTYFDTTTGWNATNATFYANGSSESFEWYLTPALAGPVNVTDFSLGIWAQSLSAGATNAQTTVELWEVNDTGALSQVHSQNFGSQNFPNTPALKQLNATLAPAHTFAAGSSLKLILKLNPGTGSLQIMWDTARADSRLVLRTADSIAVSSIEVADSTGTPVSSLDPQASNKTAEFTATVTDPYGGYDVVDAHFTILAPNGSTIVDNATMARASGTPLSFATTFMASWDYSGRPSGEYTALVYAIDNTGVSWFTHFAQLTYGPYGDSLARNFYIGSLPLFAWVKVVDDHAVPLSGASVRLESSGSPVASGTTDAAGLLNLTAFAGNYTVKVTWGGVQVASTGLNLTANVTEGSAVTVAASVFYPTLKVEDSRHAGVEHAFVYLTYANGTSTVVPFRTDDNGSLALSQVVGGPLGARVLWRGVEVAAASLTVSSSGQLTVPATVYYLSVQVNDGSGNALPLALVRMDDATFGLLSVASVTDSAGRLEERLPGGTYDLSVNWRGFDVGGAAGQALSADTSVTVQAAVYALTVKAVAADGSPLSGVTVTVTTAGGAIYEVAVTGADGAANVRAPGGNYSVSGHYAGTAYWSSIDETESASGIVLDQPKTVTLNFTRAPGSFIGSNMFIALLVIVVLLAGAFFMRRGLKAQVEEAKSQHAGQGAQAEAKPGETKQSEK